MISVRSNYESSAGKVEKSMKMLHFPIMIEIDEDGYFIASCSSFKGCHSYGETIDEALENIKEVIAMCLEEQELEPVNKFVGFREVEIAAHV